MAISRRDFILTAIKTSAGLALAIESLTSNFMQVANALGEEEISEHHWGFVVDTTKCIGCGFCVEACKRENNVPLNAHVFRTWVEKYVITMDGEVIVTSPNGGIHGFKESEKRIRKGFFVPKLCNQCDKPPCVQVCPVGATYKTKDGVILVDSKYCVGCRYCIQACPYGARFIHPVRKVADKCTWCYHRITKGFLPACVQECPVGARIFGDLNDPNSAVSKILREERVAVLKPSQGTEPKVFYVGLDKEVI